MQYDFERGDREEMEDRYFYKLVVARVLGIVGIVAITFGGLMCGESLAKKYDQERKEQNIKQIKEVGYFNDSLEKIVQ